MPAILVEDAWKAYAARVDGLCMILFMGPAVITALTMLQQTSAELGDLLKKVEAKGEQLDPYQAAVLREGLR